MNFMMSNLAGEPNHLDQTFFIESWENDGKQSYPLRDEVSSNENEYIAFDREYARILTLRKSLSEPEPIVIRLVNSGDREYTRRIIA